MESKYIDVRGIKTRYLEAGKGEPLLLVHGGDFGGFDSANDWDLNIDGLAKSFHVFAIDRIGCGFTDNPKTDKEYVIGTGVQHAYDFLRTMKMDSAHVVGHSRGGYVVCRLAMEHPEVVKTLIIVDSQTLLLPDSLVETIYADWGRLASIITDKREKYRYLAAANSYRNEGITDDFVNIMVEVMALPKSREAATRLNWQHFEEDLTARQKENREWISAGRIKAPTLIIWGFNDPTAKFDPVALDALCTIFAATPQSQMHIFNRAGHYCFRDQPETFNVSITRFIKLNGEGR
ncbi:alpha/beta fold hydrolase [Chloroflexota bacterium]